MTSLARLIFRGAILSERGLSGRAWSLQRVEELSSLVRRTACWNVRTSCALRAGPKSDSIELSVAREELKLELSELKSEDYCSQSFLEAS